MAINTSEEKGKKESDFKVITGNYLTGLGQEEKKFSFLIHKDHPSFETIQVNQICCTFLQDEEEITSFVSLIRVDQITTEYYAVQRKIRQHEESGIPLLPICCVDLPISLDLFLQIQQSWEGYLAKLTKIIDSKMNQEK